MKVVLHQDSTDMVQSFLRDLPEEDRVFERVQSVHLLHESAGGVVLVAIEKARNDWEIVGMQGPKEEGICIQTPTAVRLRGRLGLVGAGSVRFLRIFPRPHPRVPDKE